MKYKPREVHEENSAVLFSYKLFVTILLGFE